MKKILFILVLFPALGCFTTLLAERVEVRQDSVYLFRFVAERDMFYIPWSGNDRQLRALTALVSAYSDDILDGKIPVMVDGYCTSLPTQEENLRTAAIRSNRVKSELILRAGLREECFLTGNKATAYKGLPDVVVVMLRIPAAEEPKQEAVVQPEPEKEEADLSVKTEHSLTEQPEQTPQRPEQAEPVALTKSFVKDSSSYLFAVRTNVLYDAFLTPTLGVEWRINRHVSVKLDGSLAGWGSGHGKVQKMWLLNPEVRWYMGGMKCFYLGVSGNFGRYNVYRYPVGSLFSKDTGYQGKLWGAGMTVGYQFYLSRSFSLDFNVGLGYIRSDYDSYRITGGARIFEKRDRTKNFWGPTQAGINVMWKIGGIK